MPQETSVRVQFTRDYEVQDERAGTAEAERYKRDQKVTLPMASAQHFMSRGAAVLLPKTGKR